VINGHCYIDWLLVSLLLNPVNIDLAPLVPGQQLLVVVVVVVVVGVCVGSYS
jgi:hypothetical protein